MDVVGLTPLLAVEDVGASAYFYKDALGFRTDDHYERDGTLVWVSLRSHSVRLMLYRPPEPVFGEGGPPFGSGSAVLCFAVEDVTALHADLQARGYDVGELRRGDNDTKEFYLRDPDGYLLAFMNAAVERDAAPA